MVLNALRNVEECLFYMAGIKDQSVFNFVAIPQAMAIATLELVFRNPDVFKKNVKITKGDACQLMMESSTNLRSVCDIFKKYARRIAKKNTPRDPNYLQISLACSKIEQFIESIFPSQDPKALSIIHRGPVGAEEEKRAAEQSESKKDVFFMLVAVLGTLLVISLLMIGAAYLAGARFDVAFSELKKGNLAPNKPIDGGDAQAIAHDHDHAHKEL